MGFFGNKKPETATEVKPARIREQGKASSKKTASSGDHSFLSSGMVLEGTLTGTISVFVEGLVKGKIASQADITVCPKGKIEAEIECRHISIQGEVIGNIHASESITIESTGVLKGDIWSKSFINEPGGFFEGYSHMKKKPSKQSEDKKK